MRVTERMETAAQLKPDRKKVETLAIGGFYCTRILQENSIIVYTRSISPAFSVMMVMRNGGGSQRPQWWWAVRAT